MATKASFTGGPGTSVGRYEVITKLFESELGTLSAARVASGDDSGKTVALRMVEAGTEALEAMAALARRVKKLGHELVIPVIDAVEGDKKLAVVSEYIEGEALGTLLRVASVRRAALPVPVALRLTLDLLEALEFVHGKADELGDDGPKVFGGLTPGGVLMGSDGRARLMEIGLSGYSAGVEPWSKDPKRVAYLAPEAVRKEGAVGASAYVFTVGVLLWEMIQNKRLFGGLSFSAVSAKVLEQKIPAADAGRAPGSAPVSSALVAVVAKALERDPAARYATIAEMAAAIRAAGDDVATSQQAAELVEQLAGRTIAGYRNSIAKGPMAKAAPAPAPAAAPAPPAAEPGAAPGEGSEEDKSPPPKKEAPKPAGGEPEPGAEDEAKEGKKLPPPRVGGTAGADRPAPTKPALPARAGAGVEEEVSVEDALLEGEAAAPAEREPETLEKEHPGAGQAPAKAEGGLALDFDEDEPKAEENVKAAPAEAEAGADKPEAAEPKAVPKPAEAELADEPLSDAAVLPVEEKIEVPKEPGHKGLFLAIVGAVVVVAIVVVVISQLGGSGTPERSTPSATPAATAAPSSTATAAPPSASAPEPAPSATTTATETATATSEPAEPGATATGAATRPTGKLPPTAKPPATATAAPKPKPTGTPTKKYMPPDL